MLGALCVAFAPSCASVRADATVSSPSGSIAFAQDQLELKPGDVVDVALRASADVSTIAVALDGDYADASLDSSTLSPAADGSAHVRLHAPSSAANFYLTASADRVPAAKLYIAVSADGYATLHVLPSYQGKRPAPIVVASAFLKGTCKDLGALAPKDGAPIAMGMLGRPITLASVPAGGHVAVSVRIAHYASGCVDIDALDPSSTRDVPVTIFDRPMDLSASQLLSTFTFTPDPVDATAWSTALGYAATQAVDALSATKQDEATHLLDAMADSTANPSEKAAFTKARGSLGWDAITAAWLYGHGSIRDLSQGWLQQGLPLTQKDVSVNLGSSTTLGSADVTVDSLGSIPASTAGISAPAPFTWTADQGDVLHIQGALQVLPTALAAAAANAIAVTAVPTSTDVPSALAIDLDCAGLGVAIASGGYAFSTCDATCIKTLCSAGLAAMWTNAAGTSSALAQEILVTINASAAAIVGDYAEPVSFSGAWVGTVTAPSAKFASKGAASGAQSFLPPK